MRSCLSALRLAAGLRAITVPPSRSTWTDICAAACFGKGREKPDMFNYLRHSLKTPWRPSVFMVTGRKIGCTVTLDTAGEEAIEARAKAGLAMQGAVKVGAALDPRWREAHKIKYLSGAQVQVRYRSSPNKAVTTQKYAKSAVMGRDDEDASAMGAENGVNDGRWEHMAERVLDELRRV